MLNVRRSVMAIPMNKRQLLTGCLLTLIVFTLLGYYFAPVFKSIFVQLMLVPRYEDHFNTKELERLLILSDGEDPLAAALRERVASRLKVTVDAARLDLPVQTATLELDHTPVEQVVSPPNLRADEHTLLFVLHPARFQLQYLDHAFAYTFPGSSITAVSLPALRDGNAPPELVLDRLEKVALRAVGTYFGFGRSLDPNCVMVFNFTLDDLDRSGTGYCTEAQLSFLHERQILRIE